MKKMNISGKTIKSCLAILCLVALPTFTMTVPTAHADDKTVGEKIDDTVITGKVKKNLITDDQYKYSDIKVHTMKGTVLLSGFANTSAAKSHATDVAKAVEGVTDVKNDITVK